MGGASRRRATNQLIIQAAAVSRATLLYIHAWQRDTLSLIFVSLFLFPTSSSAPFAHSLTPFLLLSSLAVSCQPHFHL